MNNSVTTWRYSVPSENGEGWAVFFLDSIGCFSALSDYGNYGYRWDEAGWGPQDFRTFVTERGDDSLLEKLTRGALVYDGEATVLGIKKHVLSERRADRLTSFDAREEWAWATVENGVEIAESDFWNWLSGTNIEDAHEFMKSCPPPQAVSFIKRVIPRLREAIRVELEAEANSLKVDPDARPGCPGPYCKACNGEACDLCGAGMTSDPERPYCEHDVLDRHTRPEDSGVTP